MWLLAILLLPVLGALAWLFLGRPRVERAPQRPRRAPVAPDDDPDFLRSLRHDPPPKPAPNEGDAGEPQPGT